MNGEEINSGIDLIGHVPWGTHFCQFYETQKDLTDILVPYFKAGLEGNEYCMWVTSEPLQVEEARAALKKAVTNLDDYIKKGQLEILDYSEWYTRSGKFDADEVLQGWLEKENLALKKGLGGLRLTGNTFWLEPKNWEAFTEYEAEINKVIGNHRMIAVCTYSLDRCGAAEVIDVVNNHKFALIRRQDKWQLMESTTPKRLEESLRRSEDNFRRSMDASPLGIRIVSADGELLYANQAILDIYGYDSVEELKTTPRQKMYTPESYAEHQVRKEKRQRGEYVPSNYEISIVCKNGGIRNLEVFRKEVLWNGKPQFQVLYNNITKRRQHEKLREFTRSLLEIANLGNELNPTLKEFVRVIRNYVGCDAAGIRVLDNQGNIPYQAYEGFSREFYESESPLSIKLHQCMCVNVIKGDTNPGLPYYTEGGSFYMNGTTAFLATVSEEEKGSTRNVCNEHGYESVALVPIQLGDKILGLIHIADKRTNMVPLDLVKSLEGVALQIGLSLQRLWVEHKLAQEKERLEVTLSSTGDGIIAVDVEGRVTLLNKVAEQLTGWTQKEAVGRSIREVFNIIDERTRQPILNPVENVLKTSRVVGLVNHALLISRDRTERLIADSGAPIHDEQGRMFGAVMVFRDITELRRLQEEQIKVDKLESLGILAGGIAHDFNNLLTGILGNVQLAKLDREVGEASRAADELFEAENACLRAKALTQQLLTFSRGGAPIRKSLSIKRLVEDSTTFALRGSNVRCNSSMPDDLGAVEADEGQIGQVINNLVINADQAMPQGGIIEITATNRIIGKENALLLPGGNYIELMVKDHGIGIAKEHINRIFDPYFTTKHKGSGLGLTTAYSIIKAHGGHITVESELGVGTTFHVYLPSTKRKPRKARKIVEESPSQSKGRILVMDDEEIIRKLLDDVLTRAGYEVVLTKNGAEAIDRYTEAKESGQPIDAVILDLTIPGGMGGEEAMKKLLQIDPEVKGIVSSGYANDPVMAEYKKHGFSAMVAKPYKMSELRETLHSVLKS
jgi:PAS domain S-box-containing protein